MQEQELSLLTDAELLAAPGRSLAPEAVAALDEALCTLERGEPRLARIAECRIFSGMECTEIATVLGVTERTVQREWQRIKALLLLALESS